METIKGTREDGTVVEYLIERGIGGRLEEHPFSLDGFGVEPDAEGRYEYYEITRTRDGYRQEAERGALLWLPEIQRGGVVSNGDAVWSDAADPADLARRVLISGEILS